MTIIEIAGWTGAALILLAYFMAASGSWPASSLKSAAINTIGSAGILANAASNGAWPSVGLNAAWILIALRTLALSRAARTGAPDARDAEAVAGA